jgi:arylsulfatase A-like enzyme
MERQSSRKPAEGQNGTISELLAQNMIPNTIEQQLAALDKIGGLDALGTSKTDSMYHAGWAWAGDTPFRYTKLVASHFGGTRNPLIISWAKGIKPDKTPRPQFHHVNDIAPTIYDICRSSRRTWSTDGSSCRSTASA